MSKFDTWAFLSRAWNISSFLYGSAKASVQEAEMKLAAEEAARPPDPMEGFATGDELNQYQYKDGDFYLGHIHEDHGSDFEAGIDDDRGIFIVAGPRTGKGSSLIIPNLIRWPGPVFVIDPKGENASITAMRRGSAEDAKGTGTSVRQFIGQKVAILDPLGQTQGPARACKVNYNPFVDLDPDAAGGLQFIRSLAEALVPPEAGQGSHFSANAQMILCGVIEAVMDQQDPEDHTLAFVENILDGDRDNIIAYLAKTKTRARLAKKAVGILNKVGDDEGGGFFTTIAKNMQWLAEPGMQDHLAGSIFSLKKAMQEGWSIYVVIPPKRVSEFKHWLRLITNIALTAKDPDIYGHSDKQQTLFFLDEFPVLGHFKVIEETAGFLGSFGIKLVPVIQNIGQIKRDYDKNWETFMGTSGAILAFGLNDGETESYLAERLGKIRTWQTSVGGSAGMSGGGMSSGQSLNSGWQERPIRFANDIREEGARETMRGFVIPAGKGFTIRRVLYMELQDQKLFDSPAHIKEWEVKYGH